MKDSLKHTLKTFLSYYDNDEIGLKNDINTNFSIRFLIHKINFIYQKLHSFDYKYALYCHGPYSPELTKDFYLYSKSNISLLEENIDISIFKQLLDNNITNRPDANDLLESITTKIYLKDINSRYKIEDIKSYLKPDTNQKANKGVYKMKKQFSVKEFLEELEHTNDLNITSAQRIMHNGSEESAINIGNYLYDLMSTSDKLNYTNNYFSLSINGIILKELGIKEIKGDSAFFEVIIQPNKDMYEIRLILTILISNGHKYTQEHFITQGIIFISDNRIYCFNYENQNVIGYNLTNWKG